MSEEREAMPSRYLRMEVSSPGCVFGVCVRVSIVQESIDARLDQAYFCLACACREIQQSSSLSDTHTNTHTPTLHIAGLENVLVDLSGLGLDHLREGIRIQEPSIGGCEERGGGDEAKGGTYV